MARKMLKETLKKMAEATAAKLPAEALAVVQRTTQEVAESIANRKTPKVGDTLPAFELPDSRGSKVSSNDLIGDGHSVITFFRGGW